VTDGCGCDAVAKTTVASLIEKLSISQPKDTEVDVLDGRAGAIRALLFAAEKRLDPGTTALQSAIRFGHEIIGLAERGDDGWSWRTTATATTRNLLGYSHGTAGIACALDDLFRVTGEHVFQQGARAAWQHEISWFDEGAQNWPDFRVTAADESRGESRGAQFAFSWCHGAPGTALALARHIALDPESRPHLEAVLGRSVETTIASIGPPRQRVNGLSFCLCHGIAGNADIVLEITRLSGRKDPHPAVLAAAHAGMDRHHESGDWPCGVPGGDETPALLLGLSGIGHFYLRLHDASVPSPLLF
jgi:lantibiotic modifying enzyme